MKVLVSVLSLLLAIALYALFAYLETRFGFSGIWQAFVIAAIVLTAFFAAAMIALEIGSAIRALRERGGNR